MPIAPFDDDQIENEDGLVRFVHAAHIVRDDNTGSFRPSSASFDMSSDDGCMSVDLMKLLADAGYKPTHNLSMRADGTGAVALTAQRFRDFDLAVFQDPLPENEFHGQVANLHQHGRISRSVKKKLAEAAQWLFNPRRA